MLVKKGGISRNIDEKRLNEYKAKGYTVVDKPDAKKKDAAKGNASK
jgi:hypothetical protein